MAGQTTGIDWRGGTLDAANWPEREHRREEKLSGKSLVITDNHQYAIFAWRDFAKKCVTAPVLVSIDYHPDTDPPFYFYAVGKAAAKNPMRLDELTAYYQEKMLEKARTSLIDAMPQMNNDEQINTAMALGILSDYHMINCMAAHKLATGTHYLAAHDGDLSDNMFKNCGAAEAITQILETQQPFILDIDLDYFPENTFATAGDLFGQLVRNAAGISMARSVTYFNNLKRDVDFSMGNCETTVIRALKKIDGCL